MNEFLREVAIECPYCGEVIHTVIDLSAGGQEYIEDCQVCCRPMVVSFSVGHDGGLGSLAADRDDA